MTLKRRSGQYWAVEFSGDEVRLCRFSVQGEQVAVEQCQTRAAADFDFKRFREEIGANGAGDADILCALPRHEVFLKPFSVPRSEGIDLGQMTALKLEQSFGNLDLATTFWGYLEGGAADGKKRIQILAGAVSRSYVEQILAQHFGDSQRPAVMECSALAAIRAHLALQATPVCCELVVDCAPDGFSVFVVKDGEVESTHFVPSNHTLDIAVNEIRRLVVLHRGKREQTAIESVCCLGGEVAAQLAAALRTSLGIPVAHGLGPAPAWIANAAALPSGWDREWHRVVGLMALTRASAPAAINFLASVAPRRQAKTLLPALTQMRAPVLVATLVLLLAATVFARRTLVQRREDKMSVIIEKGHQISTDLQHSEQALAILKRYNTERFSLTKLMIEIADLAPPGIMLDTLALNADGSLAITGRCQNYVEGQEFIRKLNESKLFAKAEAPSLRKERDAITFKMTFALEPTVRKVIK
jgi:Tfp pilus assembly protein PilN